MSIIVNGVELTEVIYAGVNLDIVKVKKGTAGAVTVFEKLTTPQNVTADGTNVSWDEVENATSYAVLADGSEIGTVEGAVTNLISFTIAGTSYQAEEGMTWEEWCNSSYNTDGYYVQANEVYTPYGASRVSRKQNEPDVVMSSDTITSGYNYGTYGGGGAGN